MFNLYNFFSNVINSYKNILIILLILIINSIEPNEMPWQFDSAAKKTKAESKRCNFGIYSWINSEEGGEKSYLNDVDIVQKIAFNWQHESDEMQIVRHLKKKMFEIGTISNLSYWWFSELAELFYFSRRIELKILFHLIHFNGADNWNWFEAVFFASHTFAIKKISNKIWMKQPINHLQFETQQQNLTDIYRNFPHRKLQKQQQTKNTKR